MSKRAEAAARKAYPIQGEWVGNQYGGWDSDINSPKRNAFQKGYEQAEKDTIERAVKWLETHRDDYPFTWYNEIEGESGITDVCIEEFRKAMEE